MAVTKKEARAVVHSAFYRIVRQAEPTTLTNFYNMKVEDTVPSGRPPSGWPGFWWESIAVEIQNAMITRKVYILDFNAKWLSDNKSKKWDQVLDYIGTKLVPSS